MTEEQMEIFKKYCYSYANRFLLTVCANTGDGWLPKMCQFKWWRVCTEMEDKFNIKIKEGNQKYYKIYESIMLEVLNKRIDECKKIQSEKDKKAAKNKNVKRKKD